MNFVKSPAKRLSLHTADARLYREIVGSLIYIMTATRPDLCYSATKVSQHMSNPTVVDYNGKTCVMLLEWNSSSRFSVQKVS